MINLLNQIAIAWWAWMGQMFWQVSVLILIVGVIDILIRKWAWPQVRYALWLLVLLKLLIPPYWSLPSAIIPKFQEGIQIRIEQQWEKNFSALTGVALSSQIPVSSDAESAPEQDAFIRKAAAGQKTKSSALTGKLRPVRQVYFLGIWFLGMALFAGLLARRIRKLRRWHKEQEERKTIPVWFHKLLVQTTQRLKLERLPAIVFSDEAVTPAVYGVFHPVLLLPASYLDSLSPEEAEHVLLHELAHIKRGDLWLHGLCLLLQIIYWFNPFMIWMRRQMKHVREICCDLTIANLLREKVKTYRLTLLSTARELLTESVEPGMGLLGVFEEPFRLVARLNWLDKNTWRNRRFMLATVGAVILFTVPCLLPMAVGKPQSAENIKGGENAAEPALSVLTERESQSIEKALGQEKGDVYIREVSRLNTYFLGSLKKSEITGVMETWIGDEIIALIERGKRRRKSIILDLKNKVFRFISHKDKTYVEVLLPVDRYNLVSDEIRWQEENQRFTGSVFKTKITRETMGKKCIEYQVKSWEIRGNRKFNHELYQVWATMDVSFDLSIYYELLKHARLVYYWDENFRKDLEKIEGLQIKLQTKVSGSFIAKKEFVQEMVEITQRKPPDNIYSVPEGYERIDRIREKI